MARLSSENGMACLHRPYKARYLSIFDAYAFFKALGDAIEIGPTGNNLRDLSILLAY